MASAHTSCNPSTPNRAAEIKTQLSSSSSSSSLHKKPSKKKLTPQQKGARTRARNVAMLNGDYSSYVFQPNIPPMQPEVRHIAYWRYWVCCTCRSICWFEKDDSVNVSDFPHCGSGKKLKEQYCQHARCENCRVESLEGNSWLWPGIDDNLALVSCLSDDNDPKPEQPGQKTEHEDVHETARTVAGGNSLC